MPPKAKFSKQQIIEAALGIVRTSGFEALTARALGERLGSSARPIFTIFEGMEQVQQAVLRAAKALYREYVERGLSQVPAFKGVGMQYILFAVQEPKLFQLLFMAEQAYLPGLGDALPQIDESYNKILSSLMEEYQLTPAAARRLYYHLWIYTHGIGTLCATKMCRYDEKEVSARMTELFVSLLKNERGNRHD